MKKKVTGNKQHHIPQMLLKGFTVDNNKKSSIFVCKTNKQFLCQVHDYASEKNFYSGNITSDDNLDNKITQHESKTISKYLDEIRVLSTGADVNSKIATELVQHFTMRTKYFRNMFGRFTENIFPLFHESLTNPDNYNVLFGLDKGEPSELFRSQMFSFYSRDPNLSSIPFTIFVKMVFLYLQHNPQILLQISNNAINTFDVIQNKILAGAKIAIKNGHNNGLLKSYDQPMPSEYLLKLSWKIAKISTSGEELILPDCLTLAVANGNAEPHLLHLTSENRIIVFPFNRNTLLIGSNGEVDFNIANYNRYAAENSLEYFICSPNFSNQASDYLKYIGKNSDFILKKTAAESYASAMENLKK